MNQRALRPHSNRIRYESRRRILSWILAAWSACTVASCAAPRKSEALQGGAAASPTPHDGEDSGGVPIEVTTGRLQSGQFAPTDTVNAGQVAAAIVESASAFAVGDIVEVFYWRPGLLQTPTLRLTLTDAHFPDPNNRQRIRVDLGKVRHFVGPDRHLNALIVASRSPMADRPAVRQGVYAEWSLQP